MLRNKRNKSFTEQPPLRAEERKLSEVSNLERLIPPKLSPDHWMIVQVSAVKRTGCRPGLECQ